MPPKNVLLLTALMVVTTVGLILVACGGSKASEPSGALATGQEGRGDLDGLLAKAASAQFQASYDLKAPADNGSQEGNMTIAIKGERSALTFSLKSGREKLEATFIDDGKDLYLCGALMEGEKACYKAPREASEGPGSGLLSGFQELNPTNIVRGLEDGQVQTAGTQTIAGRRALCFRVSEPSSQGRICADEKLGVPLLIVSKDSKGEESFRATKFSEKVSNEAFKPPFKVRDINDLLSNR